MITAGDFYKVMCAMVPLYLAMLVAYGSVKWWKIFSAEQCSGINRFVSFFAVPVLSFHFISQNNPYEMDSKFILADTLSKLFVLTILSVLAVFWGGLDWLITLFSVATLPNTLVMGIPLLNSMYGDFTQRLMVQLLVLQCIVWYTLLLFLLEYRAARVLIRTQFPGPAAASITQIEVDNDVVSLDGRDPLRTESETDGNGRIRIRIRRSVSSITDSSSIVLTPRASNLSNAEIFSIHTPGPLHNDIVLCSADAAGGFGYCRAVSPRLSGYTSSDVYSLQPTPRASNFNEMDVPTAGSTPIWIRSPVSGKIFQPSPIVPSFRVAWDGQGGGETAAAKQVGDGKEASFRDCTIVGVVGDEAKDGGGSNGKQAMPDALVMLKLILVVVGRKLSRNPNSYSSILGLLWSLISFRWNVGMPSLIKYSIKIISDAGLGMAMFSLGLYMALQPRIIACGTKKAVISLGIRFLFGPLVMSVASIVMRLKGVKLHAAIVQAALPQGIVPFVFAREYGLHPDILSTGVIFGMLVSLPVTLLYYILLGLK